MPIFADNAALYSSCVL